MKILLDSCVWGGTKNFLLSFGYDVIWSGDWKKDPGDEEIINFAYKEKRLLITLDKDFGELAILKGKPHFGIVRLVDFQAKKQGPVIVEIINKYQSILQKNPIIVAYPEKIRIKIEDV